MGFRDKKGPLYAALRAQPSSIFRRNPWFYFYYDGAWLCILLMSILAMYSVGWTGFGLDWGLYLIPMLLGAIYVQILCSVFIHNASHINWPKSINRIVGEICGVIIMTRFASWEILHRRHHAFSDDEEKDPHYVPGKGYWRFVRVIMAKNLEANLHQQYFERFGDTPKHRRREVWRSILSYTTMLVLFYTWYMALGSALFWAVLAPSAIAGILHISHFNWITHRGDTDGPYEPVNLDDGIYRLGNRLCFGLYYHANHHASAGLFNPMHYRKQSTARPKSAPA